MNVENMTRLRDHLRGLLDGGQREKFDMNHYMISVSADGRGKSRPSRGIVDQYHHCSTAACLTGWASALMHDFEHHHIDLESTHEWLGLSRAEADFFEMGRWCDRDELSDITLEQAVRYLDRVLELGRVRIYI